LHRTDAIFGTLWCPAEQHQVYNLASLYDYIRWDPWRKLVDCHSSTTCSSASWSSQRSSRQGYAPLSRQSIITKFVTSWARLCNTKGQILYWCQIWHLSLLSRASQSVKFRICPMQSLECGTQNFLRRLRMSFYVYGSLMVFFDSQKLFLIENFTYWCIINQQITGF
jgi:hypothetical protein